MISGIVSHLLPRFAVQPFLSAKTISTRGERNSFPVRRSTNFAIAQTFGTVVSVVSISFVFSFQRKNARTVASPSVPVCHSNRLNCPDRLTNVIRNCVENAGFESTTYKCGNNVNGATPNRRARSIAITHDSGEFWNAVGTKRDFDKQRAISKTCWNVSKSSKHETAFPAFWRIAGTFAFA